MSQHVQQRNNIYLENICEFTYKFLDSEQVHRGLCISLSSSGIFFSTHQAIDTGKALVIHIPSRAPLAPSMIAFIEVVRCSLLEPKLFEIDGTIKTIKAN